MNAIEKLQSERQRIVARLAEIDKILNQYEALQRAAESFFSTDDRYALTSDSPNIPVIVREPHMTEPHIAEPQVHVERRPKTPMADFERVVVSVLSETETPLNRSALYKALIDRDVVIGSPDESADLNTLSARMSRMNDKVINISGHGYWLKGRAYREGGYEPQEENGTQSLDDLGDL